MVSCTDSQPFLRGSKVGGCCAIDLTSLENADANTCAIRLFGESLLGSPEKDRQLLCVLVDHVAALLLLCGRSSMQL